MLRATAPSAQGHSPHPTHHPRHQNALMSHIRSFLSIPSKFGWRKLCLLVSVLFLFAYFWMQSHQLAPDHQVKQKIADQQALLITTSPSTSLSSSLTSSVSTPSLPTTLPDLWQHEQRFFCEISPFLNLKETVEKQILFGSSVKFLMLLLPFGRDIVSTEIHSHRGWDNTKTREMLKLMQGHRPRLNYTVSTSKPFVRTPDELMSNIERNRLFVDVGANIGWFTLAIAAAGYRVASFEPLQHNELALRTSICRNDFQQRVQFYHMALGAEKGKCAVYSESKNVGDGHVICRSEEALEAAREKVRRIDEEIEKSSEAIGSSSESNSSPITVPSLSSSDMHHLRAERLIRLEEHRRSMRGKMLEEKAAAAAAAATTTANGEMSKQVAQQLTDGESKITPADGAANRRLLSDINLIEIDTTVTSTTASADGSDTTDPSDNIGPDDTASMNAPSPPLPLSQTRSKSTLAGATRTIPKSTTSTTSRNPRSKSNVGFDSRNRIMERTDDASTTKPATAAAGLQGKRMPRGAIPSPKVPGTKSWIPPASEESPHSLAVAAATNQFTATGGDSSPLPSPRAARRRAAVSSSSSAATARKRQIWRQHAAAMAGAPQPQTPPTPFRTPYDNQNGNKRSHPYRRPQLNQWNIAAAASATTGGSAGAFFSGQPATEHHHSPMPEGHSRNTVDPSQAREGSDASKQLANPQAASPRPLFPDSAVKQFEHSRLPVPLSNPTTPLSATALLRLRSLRLTREWNHTEPEGSIPRGYYVRNEVVQLRLDSLLKEEIHLLKVDVEGFEGFVLEGARGIFERYSVKYIIIEYSPNMLKEKGYEASKILYFFQQYGYDIRHIQKGFNIDEVIAPDQFDTFCKSNAQHVNRQCELFVCKREDIDE